MKKSPVYTTNMRLAIDFINSAMKEYAEAVTLGKVVYNYATARAIMDAWMSAIETFSTVALEEETDE